MTGLYIIVVLLGILILYLSIIIFLPVLQVAPQPMSKKIIKEDVPSNREDVSFIVKGDKLYGWFYKAQESERTPCIVMNHGFGGTKDAGLEDYALRFNEAGFSVLTYDYRFFGESEGLPRQLFCGPYQLEDMKAAVEYIRSREDVDEKKVVLWGTSAGAPYTIVGAAQDQKIAAVIGQCGSFDHKEDSRVYIEREGWGFFFKLFMHGQRDKGRSRFGLSPHTFPAYGKPGTVAMLTAPGVFEGIEKLTETSKTFLNETCARLSLLPHIPDPIKLAPKVKCPVHIAICQKDEIVSAKSHIRLQEQLKSSCEVREYPTGHFEIYSGEWFQQSTDDQIAFLKKYL